MRFILLTCLTLIPAVANATTYYVDQAHGSASDSNACTSESLPCLTINGGIGKMSGGDTLIVKAGTYTEGIGPTFPVASSWDAPTTIRANTGDTVTIRNSGENNLAAYLPASASLYVVINGFIFDGTNLTGPQVSIGSSDDGPGYIRFTNNEFINTEVLNAFIIGRFSHHIEISNNSIHGGAFLDTVGGGGGCCGYAFYIQGSNNTVSANHIYTLPSWPIHVYSGYSELPDNNVVSGNLIHDFGTDDARANGILFYNGSGNIAYNNVIYNGPHCIGIGGNAETPSAYNNTCYNISSSAIDVSAAATIKNNIFSTVGSVYNGTPHSGVTNNLCSVSETGCAYTESSATTFVTPGSDFHLGAASDAIDAGVDLSAVFTTDYEGTTRSGTWDIGAYNYGSTPQIDALVASFDFNEGSGLPQDSSGYGNHVTALGSGNSWTAGHTGNGVTFGGTAAATIADSNSLDLTSGFTLQAWIKQTNSPTNFAAIMAKDKTSSPDHIFWLYAAGHADYCANNGPMGGYTEPSNTWACYTTAITANVWTHLAVTYDNSLGSANLKLYVNGSQVATANGTATLTAGTGTMLIGGTPFGEYFTGIMDDVKVYNYARTAEEICTDGCGVAARQVGPIFLFY